MQRCSETGKVHGRMGKDVKGVWVTRGFEDFRRGEFDKGGQNIYVSRAGVLQRIHMFDLNRDGYVDLLFCNAQEHFEAPPAYIYHDVLDEPRRMDVPSEGSPSGVLVDLNGDGYDDLVLGMEKSGAAGKRNAYVYYGGPDGLSERYHTQLPAPKCTSVTAGDFNGDGKPDVAMITCRKLRVFYQSKCGLEAKAFVDLDLAGVQLGAADVDGDGYADLCVFFAEDRPRIYWGGPDGINLDRYCELDVGDESDVAMGEESEAVSEEERTAGISPLVKFLMIDGVRHLMVAFANRVLLVPMDNGRDVGEPLSFACEGVVSASAGDINGDGYSDVVFVRYRDKEQGDSCWVYWGGADGFSEERRTVLGANLACDVAVGDFNGNGFL